MLLGSLYIFLQTFLLLFSVAGWAHWLWRIPAVQRRSHERFFWVFLFAAGFCLGILGLQNFFYLGCRLRVTGWFAFAAAVAGNAGWVLAWRRDRSLMRNALSGLRPAGIVCLAVFLIQSSALFYWGPANYYGRGSIDQINYVLVSQFITDQPDAFHARRWDPGLEPYANIAMGFLDLRMGQSVGLGYLSVVAHGNTKSVYGVFSILVLSFGAGAVCVLLQALGIPVRIAMLAGCWWGLLPGITKMHLDGFLSQTCYIWALPLSAALFVRYRRNLGAPYLIFQSIYYAYVMSVYPEVFIVSVAVSSVALVFAARASYPRRALALVVPPVCGLLGVGWYLTLFFKTLSLQYQSAAGDVSALTVLVPWSGTWLGWSEIFFGLYFVPPVAQRAVIVLSMGFLAVMAMGLFCVKQSRRRLLLGICLVPVALPAVLASAPHFPKYAFAKLVVTFTPFWVLLAVWGCYETRFYLPPTWRRVWMRVAPAGFILAALALGLADDGAQWRTIRQNAEPLATVNTPSARRSYKYAETHKDASYIVVEDHPFLNTWLAYAARGTPTYVVASGSMSDLPPTPFDTFRVVPPALKNAVVLSRTGVLPLEQLKVPLLNVSNPQSEENDANGVRFYWLGFQPAQIKAFVPFLGGNSSQWNIHVEVTPGFSNPDTLREISLTTEDGSVQSQRFDKKSELLFPVTLHGGVNRLQLQTTCPTEATAHVQGDPRDLMIYLQQVFATPGK